MRDFRHVTDDELVRRTPREPRAFDEFYVRHEALILAYFRGEPNLSTSLSTWRRRRSSRRCGPCGATSPALNRLTAGGTGSSR